MRDRLSSGMEPGRLANGFDSALEEEHERGISRATEEKVNDMLEAVQRGDPVTVSIC